MKTFVAGGTGAIGRALVPLLIASGHEVVALARNSEKARALEAAGATPVIADPLDRAALTSAVMSAAPDAVIHQLTALSHIGNFRKFDEEFALTNRFRTEVTDTLLEAARLAGARRFIAQSFCGWPFAKEGGAVKTEADPLDPNPPSAQVKSLAAIRHLEDAVTRASGIDAFALRYGILYGPGTQIAANGAIVELVRKRKMPLIGGGGGVWSFIHVDDAARATVAAMSHGTPGIYNIVDDEPATVAEWLPALAEAVGAKPPMKLPAWVGKLAIGEAGLSMMTRARGGSNGRAKRELVWQPSFATWRRGFREGLG